MTPLEKGLADVTSCWIDCLDISLNPSPQTTQTKVSCDKYHRHGPIFACKGDQIIIKIGVHNKNWSITYGSCIAHWGPAITHTKVTYHTG